MSNAVADIARCTKRVIGILNADNEDAIYDGTLGSDSEWAAAEIADALLEADAVFCLAIISNAAHPFRSKFLPASPPAAIASGGKVPEYMGASDKVECQTLISPATWVPGRLARNHTRLREIAASTDVPEALRRSYYFREGGHIFTTGHNVRVWTPVYTRTSALQAPLLYESGLVAYAVAMLWKGTDERALHDYYQRQAEKLLMIAASGEVNLPDFERQRRSVG